MKHKNEILIVLFVLVTIKKVGLDKVTILHRKEVINMQKFFLRGVAEGMIGRSFVIAKSINDVFAQFPSLQQVRKKLIVKKNTISGFFACDG